jgi:hypothetical protein
MRRNRIWLYGLSSICVWCLIVNTASAQQQSTSTEVKNFEVVSVDGNKVVVKGEQGAQEITVPEDFRVTVDGKSVSVRQLRPGMKGSATITTTTTVTPVYVTEVRNAEVVQASASSIIVRGQNGFQMYTEGDVEKRGIKIFKNGRPVSFSDLHTRDKLTATIVTEGPPKVVTEREVQARLSSPPPPSPAPPAAPAVASTPPSAAPAAASTPPPTAPAAASTPPPTAPAAASAAPPASAPVSAPSTASPATSGEQAASSSWLLLVGLAVIAIAVLVIVTAMRRKA